MRKLEKHIRHWLKDAGVLSLFLSLGFLYYYDTLHDWFIYDDSFNIFLSMDSLKDIFFSHNYSNAFYTPLLPLSFKGDVFLFGMNSTPYHIHNLLALVLVVYVVYRIVRLYSDSVSSIVAPLIILFSTPALVCVSWITLRQYLYALLFALVAVELHVRKERSMQKMKLTLLMILLCCELSFMGKEQFLALPFTLFFISRGAIKDRLASTFPYFILLALHFVMRWAILGGLGGYLGFRYDPEIYVTTIVTSIPMTTKILFGPWWTIFLLLLPLVFKPSKFAKALCIWVSSLSVSFVVMVSYPSADGFRYWLVPIVLFTSLIVYNITLIKSTFLRGAYVLVLFVFFLVHTWSVNRDVKAFFSQESVEARIVTKALFDDKYRDAIFLVPTDLYIEVPHYTYCIARDYYALEKRESLSSFYPIEMLLSYPGIIKNAKKIYEIRDAHIVDISNSIGEKIASLRASFSYDRPIVELVKRERSYAVKVQCDKAIRMSIFSIRKLGNNFFGNVSRLPYLQLIDLMPFMKTREAELITVDKIDYCARSWCLGERAIEDEGLYIAASCVDSSGKTSPLSDFLHIQDPMLF